ncbi:MAG: hypothetical protein ACP5UZ_02335 [Thermoplasmata archaeon]
MTAEQQISQLENLLKKETAENNAKHNCYKISRIEFELAQLYKLSGITGKSNDMLKEASLSISNPECKDGRRKKRLANLISYYMNNPNAPPIVQVPARFRYISPIILVAGYVGGYVAYFTKTISYTYFFAVIIGVFIASMVTTGVISSSFARDVKRKYNPSQPFVPITPEKQTTTSNTTPDDEVDDARAELSLADMYFSIKNFDEMERHLNRAKRILSDPATNQSKKRELAVGILERLEKTVREKKPSDHFGLY